MIKIPHIILAFVFIVGIMAFGSADKELIDVWKMAFFPMMTAIIGYELGRKY